MSLANHIPAGYELVLTGKDDTWRARLIPQGYFGNKWSPSQPVEAKAHTAEEAIERVVAKCTAS